MSLQRRKTSLALLSMLSLTLAACTNPSTQPTPTVSSSPTPAPNTPSASPTPGSTVASPTPTPSSGNGSGSTPTAPTPTANPGAGQSTTVALPDGTRLVVSVTNRFLSAKGQSIQLNTRLLNQNGAEIPLDPARLSFVSSRPEDFSVSAQGLIVALKDQGFSNITVQVNGTTIQATQLVSVDSVVVGGAGGGGGSSTPQSTNLNVNANFEGLQTRATEFLINSTINDSQDESQVATDANGNFVVVWASSDQDGDQDGIYAQRYNTAGVPQGSEFRVNTYTEDDQDDPAVAMDDSGNFVITWTSDDQDGDEEGIYAQRYNTAGVPQGSEFRVNTYTQDDQARSDVAMDADGDFVVTWNSYTQDGYDYGIYAQRYNAAGEPQGSEFQVSQFTSSDAEDPSIAIDTDGDFVIAWTSSDQDGSGNGVYARKYTASGSALTSEFLVNTYTGNSQLKPDVAMANDGNFVVTWVSSGQDGSDDGIYAQRYNENAVAQSSEFRVNTVTTNGQNEPSVATDASGDFVITWTSSGQDGSDDGVYAQRYNATGVAQGSEFRVNVYTTNEQNEPSVAMDASGHFVITWTSDQQDGDSGSVYGRRY